MASQQHYGGGGQLFGYHFGSAPEDVAFHPHAHSHALAHSHAHSAAETRTSVLSQEESNTMSDFWGQTQFWGDSRSLRDNESVPGYYAPEVHAVSMQSSFGQNGINAPSFLAHHIQAESLGTMGPPLSSMHPTSGDIYANSATQNPLHMASSAGHLSAVASADRSAVTSVGHEESTSDPSSHSNTITPSPTITSGPISFATRSNNTTNQIPSRSSHYEVATSATATATTRVQSLFTDGDRYRAPVQFGTDDRFKPNGFTGPEAIEVNRDYDRKIHDTMKYFQAPASAESSHPGSPVNKRPKGLPHPASKVDNDLSVDGSFEQRLAKRPRHSSGDLLSDDDGAKKGKNHSPGAGNGSKKKPLHNPVRTNLTDEQKRSNHIRSEQKRRDTIKQAFTDLHLLVPALQATSYSKADQLRETVEWLRQLLAGNEQLKTQLTDRGVEHSEPIVQEVG